MLFCLKGSQDSVHLCRRGLWNECQHTVGAQYMSPFIFCITPLTPYGPRVSLDRELRPRCELVIIQRKAFDFANGDLRVSSGGGWDGAAGCGIPHVIWGKRPLTTPGALHPVRMPHCQSLSPGWAEPWSPGPMLPPTRRLS